MKNKIVLVTGGFDPIHSGHIKLLNEASKLGSKLIVGLNSDEWLKRKKKIGFMPISERKIIIENLKMVDEVLFWNDNDDSANNAIEFLLNKLKSNEILIFANGGDRHKQSTPELKKFGNHKKVKFEFGVGGNKKLNSSSEILNHYISKKGLKI